MGWRRGGTMGSISLLLHASVVWLASFLSLAPLAIHDDAAAPAGGPIVTDLEEFEPDAAIAPPTEIVDVEIIPPTDFADLILDPTPKPSDLSRPMAVQRPVKVSTPRPRGVDSGMRGPALASGGNAPGDWSTPKPGYPFQARRLRLQGSGGVRVTTNSIGRVVRAEMQPGIDPTLDAAATSHARLAWSGPPNATRTIAITFVLSP